MTLLDELGGVLSYLHDGNPPILDKLEDRILIQKEIYLTKVMGEDLGFSFTWDSFGPYSEDLADACVAWSRNRVGISDRISGLSLRHAVQKVLDQVRELRRPPSRWPNGEASWLELVTSLDYVSRAPRANDPEDMDSESFESVQARLLELKPYLQDRAPFMREAWERTHAQLQSA